MNYQFWTTFAAIGTFLVIAATAIAALVQLRHLRQSNQLTGLLTVLARVENPAFNDWTDGARNILPKSIEDPEFRRRLLMNTYDRKDNPWLNLANSYEWFGSLVKHGLIPHEEVIDVYGARILNAWNIVEDAVVVLRRRSPSVWENFEYLVVLTKQYLERRPGGSTYPKNFPRIQLVDRWLERDRAEGIVT